MGAAPLKTPDITSAQLVAIVGAVVAQLVDATIINGHTAQLVVGLAGIVVPSVFVLADALIRHGRSRLAAATVAASSSAAATPPTQTTVTV